MKLHKDGTIEGTPKEIAEYNRLQEHGRLMKEQIEKRVLNPNPLVHSITCVVKEGEGITEIQENFWNSRNVLGAQLLRHNPAY